MPRYVTAPDVDRQIGADFSDISTPLVYEEKSAEHKRLNNQQVGTLWWVDEALLGGYWLM